MALRFSTYRPIKTAPPSMVATPTTNRKQDWIRPVLAIGLLVLIVWWVGPAEIWEAVRQTKPGYIALAVLLAPGIWICLAKAWHPFTVDWGLGWTFNQTLRVVATAYASGIPTPGRVGEYAGRAAQVPKAFRSRALTSSFLTRAPGGFWMILGGVIGLIGYGLPDQFNEHAELVQVIYAAAVLSLLPTTILILPPSIWKFLSQKWKNPPPVATELFELRTALRFRIIGWAGLRYFIFSFQLALLIAGASGLDLGSAMAIGLITLMLKALIPDLSFAEVGILNGLAGAVGFAYGLPSGPLVAATILLGGINAGLLGILGAVLLLRKR